MENRIIKISTEFFTVLSGIILILAVCTGCMTGSQQLKAKRQRFGESEKTESWLTSADADQADIKYITNEQNVTNPFYTISNYSENHIIAWFDGHEKYESVEAFVYSSERIRVILTGHDKSQIDIWNELPPEKMINTGRKSLAGNVSFRLAENGKDAELRAVTPEGEELVLIYLGQDVPDPQYGGIADPGQHSPDGGLPVFVREKSSVSEKGSYVRIAETKYKVPVDKKISVPPFFTAYSAFLSCGYYSLIIPTYKEVSNFLNESGSSPDILKTTENKGCSEITRINTAGKSIIAFNPPFPNLAAFGENQTVSLRFALLFECSAAEEVYGTISVNKAGSLVHVLLKPEYPEWARQIRSVLYTVDLSEIEEEGRYSVRAEMGKLNE